MNPLEIREGTGEYRFDEGEIVILLATGHPPVPTEAQQTGEDFVYVVKKRYPKEGKPFYRLQLAKVYSDGKIIEHTSSIDDIEEDRIGKFA